MVFSYVFLRSLGGGGGFLASQNQLQPSFQQIYRKARGQTNILFVVYYMEVRRLH
jgi:hypothetical protein